MKRGRKPIYPWDAWLRPGSFTAVAGVDFRVRADTFVNMIRQRAMSRELRVHADVSLDGQTVAVKLTRRPAYVEAVHDPFEDAP